MILVLLLQRIWTKLLYLIKCFCTVFTKENASNLDLLVPEASMPTIIDEIQITPDELRTELCALDTSKA